MNYGLPYKGSKSRVMKWLLPLLPDGEIFVDLMCGGCSVTHAALLSHKYKRYIINDINPLLPTAFVGALDGSFRNENRWISREKFERIKETDAYASICFSFGNNCRDYLYSRKLEPYKKACHYAVVLDDWKLMKEMCPEVVNAAQTAYFVRQVGVVLETVEQFAADADGKHRHKVARMAAGGPADAGAVVENAESASHKLVEGGVESLFVGIVAIDESGFESLGERLVVLFAHGDVAV